MIEPLFVRWRAIKDALFTRRDNDSHEPYRPTPPGEANPTPEPAMSRLGTDDEAGRPPEGVGAIAEQTRESEPPRTERDRPAEAGSVSQGDGAEGPKARGA